MSLPEEESLRHMRSVVSDTEEGFRVTGRLSLHGEGFAEGMIFAFALAADTKACFDEAYKLRQKIRDLNGRSAA
jgi:hypothetical protein